MKVKNIVLFIFLIAFVCMVDVREGLAKSSNQGADFLVDIGINHYDKGEVQMAIHEFSKALMIQPDHPVALEYLNRFGLKQGIYRGIQTQASQTAELARHVKLYREQLEYLEYQKSKMEYEMESLKTGNDTLVKEQQEREMKMKELSNKIDYFESTLTKERMRRADMIGQVHNMYQRNADTLLNGSRIAMEMDSQRQELLNRTLEQEKELFELAQKNNKLREETFGLKSGRDVMMNEVEDYLYVRRDELDRLRDEVVYKEMELAKVQKQLMGKLGSGSYVPTDQNELDTLRKKLKTTEEALENAYSQVEKLLEEQENVN